MITSEFVPVVGGVSHYVYNLSKELVGNGHDVTVITRGSWKGLETTLVEGIRIHRVPYLPLYPFNVQIHRLHQTVLFDKLKSDFDIIHIHHPLSSMVDTSLPVIATIHSSLGSPGIEYQNYYSRFPLPNVLLSLVRRYLRSLERRILEDSDIVTTVSNALVNELEEHHGIDTSLVRVLGNGVDTETFAPSRSSKKRGHVLYTGRLSWNKGLMDLVRSARKILDVCPETSFILTGRGPAERGLRRLIAKMRMNDRFQLLGFVEKETLIRLYQDADVFVCPSYYEGLPTNVLEAMACGLPVVATSVGGIPEAIKDGINGYLVPIRDPEAIAIAVLKLLKSDHLRVQLGRSARATVEECYSWKRIAAKAMICYRSIITCANDSAHLVPG